MLQSVKIGPDLFPGITSEKHLLLMHFVINIKLEKLQLGKIIKSFI